MLAPLTASFWGDVVARTITRHTSASLGARVLIAAVLTVAPAIASAETAVQTPDLHAYQGRSRVLLIFAASRDDPALIRQKTLFSQARAAMEDRDLVLVEVIGTGASGAGLRQQFGAGNGHFRAVLIGKDGGAKLTSPDPLAVRQLEDVIDAMPMRRDELSKAIEAR